MSESGVIDSEDGWVDGELCFDVINQCTRWRQNEKRFVLGATMTALLSVLDLHDSVFLSKTAF